MLSRFFYLTRADKNAIIPLRKDLLHELKNHTRYVCQAFDTHHRLRVYRHETRCHTDIAIP